MSITSGIKVDQQGNECYSKKNQLSALSNCQVIKSISIGVPSRPLPMNQPASELSHARGLASLCSLLMITSEGAVTPRSLYSWSTSSVTISRKEIRRVSLSLIRTWTAISPQLSSLPSVPICCPAWTVEPFFNSGFRSMWKNTK